jgi:hypothetical protein
MRKMKVFTIQSGDVFEGARVESFTLKGAGVTIPAIIIGEEGRGRELGVLPVQLLPDNYKKWQEEGYVYIYSAEIGQTKAGKPKLLETEDADTTGKCICIFWTMIGYRGSNSHTGDIRCEYWVPNWLWRSSFNDLVKVYLGREVSEKYTKEEAMKIIEELNSTVPEEVKFPRKKYIFDAIFTKKREFDPFPGEIISTGIIAQGDAGRMGSGEQFVAIMPEGIVFRTGYSGRLYGYPAEHYYIFRDGQLLATTWEEREVTDIF